MHFSTLLLLPSLALAIPLRQTLELSKRQDSTPAPSTSDSTTTDSTTPVTVDVQPQDGSDSQEGGDSSTPSTDDDSSPSSTDPSSTPTDSGDETSTAQPVVDDSTSSDPSTSDYSTLPVEDDGSSSSSPYAPTYEDDGSGEGGAYYEPQAEYYPQDQGGYYSPQEAQGSDYYYPQGSPSGYYYPQEEGGGGGGGSYYSPQGSGYYPPSQAYSPQDYQGGGGYPATTTSPSDVQGGGGGPDSTNNQDAANSLAGLIADSLGGITTSSGGASTSRVSLAHQSASDTSIQLQDVYRHLPPELLEEIFSQLSSSKSALYNLSLSCKTFYHICKPLLYSHITITTGEQRNRLKEVRKEDEKLVRKLVIKGEKSLDPMFRMSGEGNSIGSGIIEDLFVGKLLDISVIDVLHVVFLYEDADKQPDCKTLELKAATNLVELSIQYHFGVGSLWEHVLEDDPLCPSHARFGSYNIRFFQPYEDRLFQLHYPKFVGKSGDHELVPIYLCRRPLGQRLEVVASELGGGVWTELAGKTLFICTSPALEHFKRVVLGKPWEIPHAHVVLLQSLGPFDGGGWRQTFKELKRIPMRTPSFLSLPFSRSDFTLSTLSSIEDLGIDLHFSRDEEEEDSISLIPQSFVKFVEKQKKLKEEKARGGREGGDLGMIAGKKSS